MLDYKFDKDANYIVACTYGPDSMALVDMLQKVGVKPIVAAVNYSKFRHSSEDYERLRRYCEDRGLRYEYINADDLPDDQKYKDGENFGEWARQTRYNFFRKLYEIYDASGLVLAHQQDDLLEAYLRQKDRKVVGDRYGYSSVYSAQGMIIIRPLLQYSREDLLDYNSENRVPYSMDEERYENEFTRSEARKTILALSEIERDQLLQEMKYVNDDKVRMVEIVENEIDEGEELSIRTLISLSGGEFVSTLTKFLHKYSEKAKLTPAKIAKIRAFLLNENVNDSFKIEDNLYIIKEYDMITAGRSFDKLPYSYKLEAPGKLETEQFDLDFSMGAEDRGIHAEDYPLTIRTAIPSDSCVCDSYLQPVRTLYSVWHMPVHLRYVWPVFVNKNGKIIYVPRYRENFSEYHTSVLKMHLKQPEE